MAGQSAKRASRIIQDRASKFIKVQRGPKWKRELVPDHKFDFIDVDEFRQHSCYNYFRYLVLYILIIISTASYIADLWSAGILLIYNRWSLVQEPLVPFKYSKWIFVGCIALSFLLLAWDIYKARSVVASRDISLAVTNNMAYRYYSVRSYSRFCLFRKINDSRKTSDFLAFFVFYTLKGWKKLLFAQGPRQIIAGVTVYVLLKTLWTNKTGGFQFSDDWDAYGDWPQRIALVSMSFTCLIWIFSMIELITACILYIPVFMKIQGNLKEYCCHKIDKRISELLEKQRKKRIREQEKRMQKMKKNGKKDPEAASTKLAEPTVPSIEPFDIYDDTRPLRTAAAAPAYNYSANDYAASAYSRFAPMTPYSEPAVPTQPFSPAPPRRAYTDTSYASDPYYHQYASPAPSLPRQPYYEDPGSYFEMQQYHPPASPNAQHYPPSPSSRQQHATRQYSPQPSPRQQHTSPAPYYAHQAAGPAPGNYF